jgi:hypothetical protein
MDTLIDTVWVVKFAPDDSDGTETLCICATQFRAECEADGYVFDKGFNPKHIFVKEEKVIQ